jgi:hypothetical protein
MASPPGGGGGGGGGRPPPPPPHPPTPLYPAHHTRRLKEPAVFRLLPRDLAIAVGIQPLKQIELQVLKAARKKEASCPRFVEWRVIHGGELEGVFDESLRVLLVPCVSRQGHKGKTTDTRICVNTRGRVPLQ